MKASKKSGFTLIELLVVVAIIAVIGAGVAVTYNRLDERAKTAMEISDIGTISKAIKHWSFLHNWALPNRLDSLIGTDDELYSQMSGFGQGNGSVGLYAQSGYTFSAEAVTDDVIASLESGGLTLVYKHDTTRRPANDSTFTTDSSGMMGTAGSEVDTSSTAAAITTGDALARAQAVVAKKDEALAHDYTTGAYIVDWTDSEGNPQQISFTSLAAFNRNFTTYEELANAVTVTKLAFVYPGGGAMMGRFPMPMNMTQEIISNCGLVPSEVALPTETAETARQNSRKYWLLAFGVGRFVDIYKGNGARIDTPVVSKRYNSDETIYSRYIVIVGAPVDYYDTMYNQAGLRPQVLAGLSPQALSVAARTDTYRNNEKATND